MYCGLPCCCNVHFESDEVACFSRIKNIKNVYHMLKELSFTSNQKISLGPRKQIEGTKNMQHVKIEGNARCRFNFYTCRLVVGIRAEAD